jgi:hypothetical protein
MVKLSSPTRSKDRKLSIRKLLGLNTSDKFDNDRMLVVDLKKGDAIALIDRKDNVLELSRNKQGHFGVKELRTSKSKP